MPLGINRDERHAKRWLDYPKGQPLPDCNLIPADGASMGKTSIASCGPTPGVAPARATLRVARATPPSLPPIHRFRPVAHSPERLRRWATGPAPLKGQKSTAQKFSPTLRPFILGRAPRRPPSAFAARRGRRFRTESRYSLLAYSNSPSAVTATSSDEL